ncbi:MAG: PPK2 family polyphosphate kinase [Cyanobacteria bacterium P01_H01_bin.121]
MVMQMFESPVAHLWSDHQSLGPFKPLNNSFLVHPQQHALLSAAQAAPQAANRHQAQKSRGLQELLTRIGEYQQILHAEKRQAVLLIFQGMDAAGKDSAIHAVLGSLSPTGCQVFAFKQPNHQEQAHDFLWRCQPALPERGMFSIFNRSYYEEVLAVRVHPQYLQDQNLLNADEPGIWQDRFESMCNFEKHLARNGTVILKFWLHVSKHEQLVRLESRLRDAKKHWKISAHDLQEHRYWNQYMHAYQAAVKATSTPWAPWYVIPADDKQLAHLAIAEVIAATLGQLGLSYPTLHPHSQREQLAELERLVEQQACPLHGSR